MYEKGVRCKVLIVYSLKSEANWLDIEIVENKYEGFKYMLYKK